MDWLDAIVLAMAGGLLWFVLVTLPFIYFFSDAPLFRTGKGRIFAQAIGWIGLVPAFVLMIVLPGGALIVGLFSQAAYAFANIHALVATTIPIVAAILLISFLYGTFKFIRHQMACRQIEDKERELRRRAAEGDSTARIALSMRSIRDPRFVPFWKW